MNLKNVTGDHILFGKQKTKKSPVYLNKNRSRQNLNTLKLKIYD